jgi:LPXTG-motif cell wall-anchored protein
MKRLIVTTALLAATAGTWADTPGKATNHPSTVTLQNVAALQNYTLYWHKHYGDSTLTITADTSIAIPGSGGAPDGAEFWGIHKKTGKSTDTLSFSNYYDPDYVVILSGVRNDSIRYQKELLSNRNETVATVNPDSIANQQLVTDAEKVVRNKTFTNVLLGAAAGAALGGLAWFFIRRRKKRQQADQGTGS